MSSTPKASATVVNVRVGHLRPAFDNLAEWCDEKEHVYIGRKGIVFVDGERFPKRDSPWCNPFNIGKDGTLAEVLAKYETHIRIEIAACRVSIGELRGQTLGCWCLSEPVSALRPREQWDCHGQVLLALLAETKD
jgi:hypothetical protein